MQAFDGACARRGVGLWGYGEQRVWLGQERLHLRCSTRGGAHGDVSGQAGLEACTSITYCLKQGFVHVGIWVRRGEPT